MKLLITFLFAVITTVAVAQTDEEAVYIDVRTWAEYQVDHIEGDSRIHVSEIVTGVSEQFSNKDTPIYLYCAVGGRAGKAAEKLTQSGYTNVHNAGGIDDVRALRFGVKTP
ncbi:MAG: phage shock protein E [Pseudoalteromonas tetraodonis]|jgi:phage shock protein E